MSWTNAAPYLLGEGNWHVPPYYSRSSFFNRPADNPLDGLATDQTQAQRVANQLQYGRQSGYTFQGYSGVGYGNYEWPGSVGYNQTSYSFPIYLVDPDDDSQNITFSEVEILIDGKPIGLEFGDLQSYCMSVPIPDKTLCPKITGTAPYTDIWSDGEHGFCVINARTREAWEFLDFTNSTGSWTAGAAGYIPNVDAFNGAFADLWGARATSLGAIGGLITQQDLRDVYNGGNINHALAFGLPMNAGSANAVAPATRGDGPGSNSVALIPVGEPGAGGANPAYGKDASFEGGRFRFPIDVDLSGCTYRMSQECGLAAARFGAILVDTSGAGAFYVEDPRTIGSPYHLQGADAVDPGTLTWPGGVMFSGTLQQLPWSQLQVLTPISG